jgi:YrbI family 3-deoxy-D-manno-octulosonate 8-phosphate phosphatase
MSNKIYLNNIDAFVFDFDGVLTNNLVSLNSKGEEFVSCSRSDGLAFDALRELNKPAYILSTEINPVVTARANKLKINAIQGISNKATALQSLSENENFDLKKIVYVGNDLNDYNAMCISGFSMCPSDSHIRIREIADIILKNRGGDGIVRELVEDVFKIDLLKILYSK